MKKITLIVLPKSIKYDNSIRSKKDIILILLGCIDHFQNPYLQNYQESNSEKSITIHLYISKMSRLFICDNSKKIHSFHFPFYFKEELNEISIYSYDKTTKINSTITSLLKLFFNNIDENQNNFFYYYCDLLTNPELEGLEINELETVIQLIPFLLQFEPGYIRYDHDEFNDNVFHPIDHLDLYYSSSTTFKIELDERIDYNKLNDILNIEKKCPKLNL